jgi:hypothetical protein
LVLHDENLLVKGPTVSADPTATEPAAPAKSTTPLPAGATPAPPATETPAATPASGGDPDAPETRRLIFDPTTDSSWVKPRYAVLVVAIVAFVILGILGFAVMEMNATTTGAGQNRVPTADPNAGTIAALAAAAFTAISTLTAAYFGIKVASDQSERTTSRALQVADNGNRQPPPRGSRLTPRDPDGSASVVVKDRRLVPAPRRVTPARPVDTAASRFHDSSISLRMAPSPVPVRASPPPFWRRRRRKDS